MNEYPELADAFKWFGTLPGGAFVYEARGEERILYMNERFLSIFDCETEEEFRELTGGTFKGMVLPEDLEATERSIWNQARKSSDRYDHVVYRIRTKTGRIEYIEDYGRLIPADENHPDLFVVFITDSSMRFFTYARDRITALLGMRSFIDAAEERYAGRQDGKAIVYFNLTNFKSYNTAHGIDAGDEVLLKVADVLREHFPDGMISRFSDDHFVVLCDAEGIDQRVRSIESGIREKTNAEGLYLRAGVRKINSAEDAEVPVSKLCDQAKTACDEAGLKSVRLVEYTAKLDAEFELRQYIVNNVEHAINEGWISVYFQPVVRTVTGKLCSVEALARWNDPQHGFISPGVFIPALEDSRLIAKVDAFIVGETCRVMRERIDAGTGAVPASFNLSRVDFETANPFKGVEAIASKYDIPRELLRVEITESTLMSDRERIAEQINLFHSAGYEVWMDDFGSGYSSLNVIKDFSFDEVKLDMLFMRDLDDKGRQLVALMISAAKRLGMKTLAEGVESEEQVEFLKSVGCDRIQGYYFGKPMPEGTLEVHCRENGIVYEERVEEMLLDEAGRVEIATEMPVALIDDDGENLKILHANDAFLKALKLIGTTGIDNANEHISSPLYFLGRRLREVADAVAQGKEETLAYSDGDNYVRLTGKNVATQGKRSIHRCSITIIPDSPEEDNAKHIDAILRQTMPVYNNIYLLDPKTDTEEVIASGRDFEHPGDIYTGLAHHFAQFATKIVHPDDRERFVQLSDYQTLTSRIAAGGKGYISEWFRLYTSDAQVAWREFTFIATSKDPMSPLLICVKDAAIEEQSRSEWAHAALGALNDDAPQRETVHVTSNSTTTFSLDSIAKVIGSASSEPQPHAALAKLAESVGEGVYADRVVVFEINQERTLVSATYEWQREGISPAFEILQQLPINMAAEWWTALANGRPAYIEDAPMRLGLAPKTAAAFKQAGIIDLAMCPLVADGLFVGALGIVNPALMPKVDFAKALTPLSHFATMILRNRNLVTDLETKSFTDSLTGLLNRRGIDNAVNTYFEQQPDEVSTLVIIDIDNFKLLNDLHGHATGDLALKTLAAALSKEFGADSLVGRNGGDEFMVLVKDARAADIAPRVERIVSEPHRVVTRERTLEFNVSAGYAERPTQARKFPELARLADAALYSVKSAGKGRHKQYDAGMAAESRSNLGFGLQDISRGMPGAMLVYRARGDEEILYANDAMIDMMECTDFNDFLEVTGGSFKSFVVTEDIDRVEKDIWRQVESDDERLDYVEYAIKTKSGKRVEVWDMGRLADNPEYGEVFYVLVYDKSQIKIIDPETRWSYEAIARMHDDRAAMDAVSRNYASLHVFDLVNNMFEPIKSTEHINILAAQPDGAQATINHVMQNLVVSDNVDDVLKFVDMSTLPDRLKDRDIVSIVFKDRAAGWRRGSWNRMDDCNPPRRALFAVEDIDEEISRERLASDITTALALEFESVQYIDKADGTVHTVRETSFAHGITNPLGDAPHLTPLMHAYVDNVVHPDDREAIMKFGKLDYVEQLLSEKPWIEHTYRRLIDDEVSYRRLRIAQTSDKTKFIFGYENVDEEVRKLAEERRHDALLTGLSREFASLWYFDAGTKQAQLFSSNREKSATTDSTIDNTVGDFDTLMNWFIDSFVVPEDQDKMREQLSLEHLVEHTTVSDVLQLNFSMYFADGKRHYAQACVARVDVEAKDARFICGFRNADPAVEAVVAKQEELEAEREKLSDAFGVIDGLTSDYHTVWAIDKATTKMRLVRTSLRDQVYQSAIDMLSEFDSWDGPNAGYIQNYVEEIDRAHVAELTTSEAILKRLETCDRFEVNFRQGREDGSIGWQQMVFANADTEDGKKRFVCGIRDLEEPSAS